MNTTCCDDHLGELALQGHARIPESVVSSIRATSNSTTSLAPQTTSSESSITHATATQTAAPTSPTTPSSIPASIPASTPLPASAGGLSQPTKIGLAIGISFGSLLIALLTYIAFRLYKARIQGLEDGEAQTKEPEELIHPPAMQQRHEMSAASDPKEMYTLHNTHEVEAKTVASEL